MKFGVSLFSVALFLIVLAPGSAHAQTPPTCKLLPQQATITKGTNFTLTWHSTSTTQGTITGIGLVAPSGSITLAPITSTQFTGTFTGPMGTTTCTASLTVSGTSSTGGSGGGSTGGGSNSGDSSVSNDSGDSSGFTGSGSGFVSNNSSAPSNPGSTLGNALVPCQGADCQACHIVDLAQNIINFMLGLSIPIVILLFAWAGVLYFTSASNPGNISKAHEIFRNAFVGFIIVLGAYLIIDTILHTILHPDYYDGWNSVKCVDDSKRDKDATIGELLGGAVEDTREGPGGIEVGSPTLDGSGKVTVKPGVSLVGVKQSTIDYANAVALQCGCNIVITAGTDGSHAEGTYSHANGYKIDIRSQDNTTLGNWVVGNGIPGERKDGTPTYTMGDVIWALEDYGKSNEHWDVQVKP